MVLLKLKTSKKEIKKMELAEKTSKKFGIVVS